MSDRASIRGARGAHGASNQEHRPPQDRPKKENILDLGKHADKRLLVKFSGGREVTGILKGWDGLMNLVLDDVRESLRGKPDHRTNS